MLLNLLLQSGYICLQALPAPPIHGIILHWKAHEVLLNLFLISLFLIIIILINLIGRLRLVLPYQLPLTIEVHDPFPQLGLLILQLKGFIQ